MSESQALLYSGEMASLSHYYHLCDSPLVASHPHLCVLLVLVHISSPQEKADKVKKVLDYFVEDWE